MDDVTCWVCAEEYWTGVREPLMLPCGHTFCRQCISSLIQARRVECPVCRRKYPSLSVNNLPKNFAVLNIALNKNTIEPCIVHGDPLRFWCVDCEERGCGECMFEAHPKDQHHVINDRATLKEKKEFMRTQVNELFQVVREEMGRREASFRSCRASIVKLMKQSRDVNSMEKELRDMLNEINTVAGLVTVNALEAKLQLLKQKIHVTVARLNEEGEEGSGDGESSTRESERERNCEEAAASGLMCLLGMKVTNFDSRESRLEWEDGRLLLNTTPFKIPPQPVQVVAMDCLVTREMPEVFLELSIGQITLGKVYIRLWNHLRRAQHFLALCLGTLGPSFVGAKLLEVTFRNNAEESVTCGDYISMNGVVTAKPLMTDLEWGCQYAGERREGMVVASSGGVQEIDTRFGISTSQRARGLVRCPFGQVVSGLEVARKALIYDPVGQVYVSRCGLVLKQQM
ncbi:uncharacterized protein [Panulirus ornatus]|uniref:uncharacterized protein n=1 Tax=Panulirus ornatus TaxID=150431 RepID=UPI003A87FCF2